MKKFRLIILVISICAGFSLVSAQTDTTLLTFAQAYQKMSQKNPSLLKAKKEVEQKEYEKEAKQGLYLPKISVGAQAVAMSDPLHLDLSQIGEALEGLYDNLGNYGVFDNLRIDPLTGNVLAPTSTDGIVLDQSGSTQAVRGGMLETAEDIANHEWDQVIQEKIFATVSASASWPIFTGGKIHAANKAASIEVNISQEELRKTEGELLTELVTRYYGLVLANEASDVMKEKYEALQKHYSDAQKMFNEGIIAKVELLHAQVELSEAEREYKSAERMVMTIQTGLTATLASDFETCYLPINNLFINTELPALNYWLSQTYNSNSLLKQIDYKKNLTTIKTNVSKGAYLPSVAIMGNYNLVDYQLSPYMPHWMVGAGMSWTLFDGLSRQKEVKANTVLCEQVDFAHEKANDELRAYITKLYNELNNKLQEINELEHTLALATEFCSSTEKAFTEGLKNSTDVAEAQSKLAQVKALRLKNFYNYDVTLATLLQIAGIPEQFINYSAGASTLTETIQ